MTPPYTPWCDRCGWNVRPGQGGKQRKAGPYTRFRQRTSQALTERLQAAERLRPSLTVSILLAYLYAGLIHAFTLLCGVAGVFLIVYLHSFISLLGGGLLVAIFWYMRPRLGKLPVSAQAPEAFPGWYGATAQIAEALGARRPRAIVFTSEFNAGLSTVGWRSTPVLRLGLPLLTILDDQEIVALLAHELAHEVNGDAARGVVVGSALNTLARWHHIFVPGKLEQYGNSGMPTFTSLEGYNGIGEMVGALIRVHFLVLRHLLYANAQRAEYFADSLAAQLAGTAATLSLMDKSCLDEIYSDAIRRAIWNPEISDFFAMLTHMVETLPEREWQRIHQVARLASPAVDDTHPSTAQRIAVLEAHPVRQAAVRFDRNQKDELQRELAMAQQQMQAQIVRAYAAQR